MSQANRSAARYIAASVLLFGLALLIAEAGCSAANPTWEQQKIDDLLQNVVKPAVEEALKETVSSGHMDAGIHGNNPGYETEFEGLWVTGVKGKAVVRLVGVDGDIRGTTTGATSRPAEGK